MLGGLAVGLHFGFEVDGDVGELLLDVSDDFPFGGSGEVVADFGEDFDHVVGEVSAGQVDSHDGVGQRVAFENGHRVGDSVSGINHDSGRSSTRVQTQHGLNRHVELGHLEGVEHNRNHFFPVFLGVHGRFGQQTGVFVGFHSQLVLVTVVPDFLHGVPVLDDSVFDRVLESQNAFFNFQYLFWLGLRSPRRRLCFQSPS